LPALARSELTVVNVVYCVALTIVMIATEVPAATMAVSFIAKVPTIG